MKIKKFIESNNQLNKIKLLIFEKLAEIENSLNKEVSNIQQHNEYAHTFSTLYRFILKMNWNDEYDVFNKFKLIKSRKRNKED